MLQAIQRNPQITVLMSAFNSETYIAEAIASILAQTFDALALLVIDDGSTDSTFEIAMSFRDTRVKVLRLERNEGLATALNIGLNHITSPYIARMDADDISSRERLALQWSFMQENPEVGLSGSFVESFGQETLRFNYPTDHTHLAIALLSYNPIAHPTVMFRRETVDRYQLRYRRAYSYCEDYDLWARAIRYVRVANLPLPLLKYRLHEAQVTNRHHRIQQPLARRIKLSQMDHLCDGLASHELELYTTLIEGSAKRKPSISNEEAALKQKILEMNKRKGLYDQALLARALDDPSLGPAIVEVQDSEA